MNTLPWLNRAIPTDVARGVRVTPAQVSVPGTGHTVSGILPAYSPSIDGRRAGVGDGNSGSCTVIPFIADAVCTAR